MQKPSTEADDHQYCNRQGEKQELICLVDLGGDLKKDFSKFSTLEIVVNYDEVDEVALCEGQFCLTTFIVLK